MSRLRIRLIQANPTVGDLESNLAQVLLHLNEAHDVDLLVFPECFLTGYPLQDLVLHPTFMTQVREALQRLAHAVQEQAGPAVLMGAPLAGTDLPYNAAILFRADGSRQTVLKTELPNNDVFDERRTFAMGQARAPLLLDGWRIGAMICEDMWHGQVSRALADEGADFLLVINGSPMEIGKTAVRMRHARQRIRTTGLPLAYLNLTGGQDELVFDGSSFILDQEGVCQASLPMGTAAVDFVLRKDEQGQCRIDGTPVVRSFDPAPQFQTAEETSAALYWTLVTGLRDYVEKNRFGGVLLGLSGGLDSALVAAIAADALGADRVMALMLPAAYTGTESRSLADQMAQHLGAHYATVPVGDAVQALETIADQALGGLGAPRATAARKLASENIQARIRGNLLMAVSNAFPGTLVLSTGNKSEMSVGYATLYGDMCGGFNPLKDVYKTKVQALSRWRNAHQLAWMKGPAEPIPMRIIERPPTAELAEDQTDEGSLGAYPVLDAVLEGLIEHMRSPAEAARVASVELDEPVTQAYAERIATLVKRAEYKRRQAPPGIKVTARSFGFGRRFPLTDRSAP